MIFILILIWTMDFGLCTNKVPENLVFVKGGIFRMGTDQVDNDEEPVHQVTLSSFYIGKFEVSQEEWQAVMGNNPSVFTGDELPVDNIDWYMAIEFCNKKSRQGGRSPCYTGGGTNITSDFEADGYRLPNEAEWKYASRGGAISGNYKYTGSDNLDEVGWYTKNSTFKNEPVGQKKANELGIHDMSGNLWEWCWDWYDYEYYKKSPGQNFHSPSSGIRQVIRGGCTINAEEFVTTTFRGCSKPNYLSRSIGLRVVRNAR